MLQKEKLKIKWNKKTTIALFIVIVLFFLVLYLKINKVETINPKYRKIIEGVYSSGVIQPKGKYILYSMADGYIESIYKHENETVFIGDVIVKINDQIQNYENNISKNQVELLGYNNSSNSDLLKSKKDEIDKLYNIMNNDSSNFERYHRLFQKKSVSKYDVEKYELQFKTSKRNYEIACKEFNNFKFQLNMDFNNSVEQYKAKISAADFYKLSAKHTGRIYKLLKEEGELVRKGEAVAILGDSADVVVELDILDADINKIFQGAKVLIEISTLPEKIYIGYVNKVYPLFDENAQAYKVEVGINEKIKANVLGASVEANIIIKEKEHTLTIPKEYLIEDNFVYVKNGFGKTKQKITIGMSSFDYVEIISGLQQSDKIIKSN